MLERLAGTQPQGVPNQLSDAHHDWPVIDEVAVASRYDRPRPGQIGDEQATTDSPTGISPLARQALLPEREHAARRIVHQRRSAVNMDGQTSIARATFYHILARLLPRGNDFPFGVLSWQPRISLAIFVHRVDHLEPGLYVLIRHPAHEGPWRESCANDFTWQTPAGCPQRFPLYLLEAADCRRVAQTVSCHQDIASDGAFALGMLAEFEPVLRRAGPRYYRRLFWEAGLIGQLLYLEAEAAGVRGTGIGCFFDDAMHEVLGIKNTNWQSLYHFTVGGPVDDARLTTIPPYQDSE
jgi:hypothetical protein